MSLDRNDETEGFGSPKIVTSGSTLVANAGLSVVGNVVEFINSDNADMASAILTFTPSALTTDGDTIKLYASKNLVDGTVSENFPSATNKKTLLATFIVGASTAIQTVTAEIQLDNCVSRQAYLFAIENLLTTVSVNAGWVLTIIPKAKGSS